MVAAVWLVHKAEVRMTQRELPPLSVDPVRVLPSERKLVNRSPNQKRKLLTCI